VRRQFHSALDLCTGSGIQALLASTHSEQVLAVDINPRAARCTRFNALTSSVANLEVEVGDLFEAVRGARFDLITANPPFVPSPLDTVRFRDGGRSGEDVQKRIVAGLAHHLMRGGIAQVVTELGERDDEPLVHRLRDWLDGAPMDTHILRMGEHTAQEYAVGHATGATYESLMDSVHEWASNLRAQGYARVASLVISFQWSGATCGPPWERVDESTPPRRAAGAEIDAVFLAERLTRQHDWQQILRHSSLHRAGPTVLLDARVLSSDIPAKAKATVLGRSLRIEHQLNPVERQVLERLEGTRIAVPDLIRILRDVQVNETTVIAATRSLLRHRLISIDG
jgi:hypothetical protein